MAAGYGAAGEGVSAYPAPQASYPFSRQVRLVYREHPFDDAELRASCRNSLLMLHEEVDQIAGTVSIDWFASVRQCHLGARST